MFEILTKWEEANKKIFERYPTDGEIHYSILEEAVSDIKVVHQEVEQEPKSMQGSIKKTGKKAKDIEMQKYMEELKQKEYELKNKAKQ